MIVKKAIIPKNELPPIDADSGSYVVRYRIISEDKNRTSQWSPTFVTDVVTVSSVSGAVQQSSSIINVVWGSNLDMPRYDIFVGYNGATPTFHGTAEGHSYQFLKTGTVNVRVIVQIESSSKTINNNLDIYNSGLVSLV
jgi:hypothetical protein